MSRYFILLAPILFGLVKIVTASSNLNWGEVGVEDLIQEKWRWTHLEALDDYDIFGGCESADGTLWFGTKSGLVKYKGHTPELVKFSPEAMDFEPYSMFMDDLNTFIYVLGSKGLWCYSSEGWTRLLSFECYYTSFRQLFCRTIAGEILVAPPFGLYLLKGKECIKLTDLDFVPSSLAISGRNELFCSPSLGSKVLRVPLTVESIRDKRDWHFEVAADEEVSGIVFMNHGTGNDVVALDFFKNSEAKVFSYEQLRWVPLITQQKSESNFHSSGVKLNDRVSVVFSKTVLWIYEKGRFTLLSGEDFPIPINQPFGFVRKNGNMIMGGRGDPLQEVDLGYDHWKTLKGLHFQCQDRWGRFWFITSEGRIVCSDAFLEKWNVVEDPVISTPTSIIASSDGTIWVAGSHLGVAAVSYFDDGIWVRDVFPELLTSISHLSAVELANGDMCFGSGHEFNVDSGGMVRYRNTPQGYLHEYIRYPVVPNRIVSIADDKKGKLWFGGKYLASTSSYLDQPLIQSEDFDVEWIDHLAVDGNDRVCVATWLNGLSVLTDQGWFKVLSPNCIASDRAVYILKDRVRKNNLWVATNKGISRNIDGMWVPDAVSRDIRMFREGGTLAEDNDGSIWINRTVRDWYFRNSSTGDIHPVLSNFHTIRFRPEADSPRVWLTHFSHESTEPANLLIEWNGKDFWDRTQSDDLLYSFSFDGGAWSPFSNKTEKILTDVKAGLHHFEVRVRDLNGNLSKNSAIAEILVKLPVWKRPWFWGGGFVMGSTIFLLMFLLIRQRIQHLLEMEEFKIQFFTNLSHELRTPLALILGPLESSLNRVSEAIDKKPLEIAHRNALKMLQLVDQILEFRRVEVGNIENHYVSGDVIAEIEESVNLLQPLAEQKSIHLLTSHKKSVYYASYDAEKLERILSNLIGNGIKYSFENGYVSIVSDIVAESDRVNLKLLVEDNGVGIEQEKMRFLFQPFYRLTKTTSGLKTRGVGLGLSLVKSLVDALDGTIRAESPATLLDGQACGTRFHLELPLLPTTTTEADAKSSVEAIEDFGREVQPLSSAIDQNDGLIVPSKPCVLLVDDEEDIRVFLEHELRDEFEVELAVDGRDALQKARRLIPDVVVTDIFMPTMDGNQLIAALKEHDLTRHIPIIALTAHRSSDSELKVLNRGAVDFLQKPVSIVVLRKKLKNIIQDHRVLLEAFRERFKEGVFAGQKPPEGSIDDTFLDRCKKLIEANLANSSFDVEVFSSEMNMSKMSLYRKLMGISGISPGDLIKEMRMQAAVGFLKDSNWSISEISDAVGYQDASNFSSAFKKFFGKSPTVFRRNAK